MILRVSKIITFHEVIKFFEFSSCFPLRDVGIMKIFQAIQYHFSAVDICANRRHWYNRKYLLILLLIVDHCTSSAAFLLLEAKNMREYADSFYGTMTGFSQTIFFSSVIFRMKHIFQLIANFQLIVRKSKYD